MPKSAQKFVDELTEKRKRRAHRQKRPTSRCSMFMHMRVHRTQLRKKRVIRFTIPPGFSSLVWSSVPCFVLSNYARYFFLNNAILVYEAEVSDEKKESTHPQSLYNECAGYVMNAVFVCCFRRTQTGFRRISWIQGPLEFNYSLLKMHGFLFSPSLVLFVNESVHSCTVYYTTSSSVGRREGWIVASMSEFKKKNHRDIEDRKTGITS